MDEIYEILSNKNALPVYISALLILTIWTWLSHLNFYKIFFFRTKNNNKLLKLHKKLFELGKIVLIFFIIFWK